MTSDPEAQRRAKEYVAQAGELAKKYGVMGADLLLQKIEQGPRGVRTLACGISAASMLHCVGTVLNPGVVIFHPVRYCILCYQLAFAASTLLFELSDEQMQKVLFLKGYQDSVAASCSFLRSLLGRGMFYLFQAALWSAFASLTDLVDIAVSLALVFIGALHVMMHGGYGPERLAEQLRR